MKRTWVGLVGVMILALAPGSGAGEDSQHEGGDSPGLIDRFNLTQSLPPNQGDALRVVRFFQATDVHIVDDDAPYPLRQENLDQLGSEFTSAQRPQEEYTDEAFNSLILEVNKLHASDRFDFLVSTGDNIDNILENEAVRFIDNLRGTYTTTGPITKRTYKPDGQSANPNDTSKDVTDAATSLPEVFKEPGYNVPLDPSLPLYVVFGNHDGLVQGNSPIEPGYNDVAARSGRYFVDQQEYMSMFFRNPALWGKIEKLKAVCQLGTNATDPNDGGGFARAGARLCDANPDNDAYYAYDVGPFHFIVLDTLNDDFVQGNGKTGGSYPLGDPAGYAGGYAEGTIDPLQLEWLLKDLKQNATRPILLFAHHTVNSFVVKDGQSSNLGYLSGAEFTAELNKYPNVVAFVGGHTHKHRIQPKTTFWNVETASLIDPPHENRVVEIYMAPNGTGYFEVTRVAQTFAKLRELGATDPQEQGARLAEKKGTPLDRDVRLWFQLPKPTFDIVRAELDRSVNGTFEADRTEIQVGQSANFTFNVTTAFTHGSPPPSTSFSGFVTDFTFIDRINVTGVEGRGTFGYVFARPGTYRVGVNVTGPDVVERWIGSNFAIVPGPLPPEGEGEEKETPVPVWLALAALGVGLRLRTPRRS